MNALIDTNVVLDILLKREPNHADSSRIQFMSEMGYVDCYISASAVTDIYYIAQKEIKNNTTTLTMIKNLLKTIRVASVTESDIHEAIDLGWDDFEDSVQYIAGKRIHADWIITHNSSDYMLSQIKTLTPKEFLDLIDKT